MLAKVIATGADRAEALRRLDAALARHRRCSASAPTSAFLRALLADPDVARRAARHRAGRPPLDALAAAEVPDDVLAAAALDGCSTWSPTGAVVDPFDVPGGWRLGGPGAGAGWRLVRRPGSDAVRGRRGRPAGRARSTVGDGASRVRAVGAAATGDRPRRHASTASPARYRRARRRTATLLARARRRDLGACASRSRWTPRAAAPAGAGGPVTAPDARHRARRRGRRGRRTSPPVSRLVVVEAMKMEHVLTAPVDGVVARAARPRRAQQVAAGPAALLIVEPAGGAEP